MLSQAEALKLKVTSLNSKFYLIDCLQLLDCLIALISELGK